MRTNWMASAIVSLTMLVGAAQAAAQTDFQWHSRLATGQTIEIKGINGDVRATASSTSEVEVTAARSARRSNPADVRIEVVPHAGGVTICAVYPTVPGREAAASRTHATTTRSSTSTCACRTASASSGAR